MPFESECTMTYRILSLGTVFAWLWWSAVQNAFMFNHALIPARFWDSQIFLRNAAPWVLPWMLGCVIAALIVLPLQKFTGWFGLAPLGGRWFMRAAVIAQAGGLLFLVLALHSIDWQMVFLIATGCLFMAATGLALVGWITFVVVALNARFRGA